MSDSKKIFLMVTVYVVGLTFLSGWFYYRSQCASISSERQRQICAIYSSIFWPMALPIHFGLSGFAYSFEIWKR